jgi:hypothetical protein
MKLKTDTFEENIFKSTSIEKDEILLKNENSLILFPIDHFSQNINKKKLFSQQNILLSFKNQNLTKYLQKNLFNLSKGMMNYIINELSGQFRDVIKNKNGNYFFSDLIKKCDKEQRLIIINEIRSNIYEDCFDEYANYPIQLLFEIASCEEELKLLLSSFDDFNKIIMASMHKYGNYVIQKLIMNIPENIRKEFNSIFVQLIPTLSRDAYGVLPVKKFINYTKDKKIIKQFINSILNNFISISENPYGNYLIQYLLEIWWNKKEGDFLKKIIISKFQILSKNEYSLHICRFFIQLCNIKSF